MLKKFNILIQPKICHQKSVEGALGGMRKPQNRTEMRRKTANRIGFFPEYRNHMYMKTTI